MVRGYLKRRARPVPPNFLLGMVFIVLLAVTSLLTYQHFNKPVEVTDFDSCVKAGNPVLLTYPGQCTHNGQSFINPEENIPKPY